MTGTPPFPPRQNFNDRGRAGNGHARWTASESWLSPGASSAGQRWSGPSALALVLRLIKSALDGNGETLFDFCPDGVNCYMLIDPDRYSGAAEAPPQDPGRA